MDDGLPQKPKYKIPPEVLMGVAIALFLEGVAGQAWHARLSDGWRLYLGIGLFIFAELIDLARRTAADYAAWRPPPKPQTPTEKPAETERTKIDR